MIFEPQLFETQIMVAVTWTTEVSQNLKMFNYSVRATPLMMNQFLSVVGVEEEKSCSKRSKGAWKRKGTWKGRGRGRDGEGERRNQNQAVEDERVQ